MTTQLLPDQATVLAYLLEHGPFRPSAQIVDYRFGSVEKDVVTIGVAKVEVEDEEEIYGIFSLPAGGANDIFLTITDGDPSKIADLVARLVYASSTEEMEFGHTLMFDKDPYLASAGRVGVVLLRIDAISALSEISDKVNLDRRQYSTHLVVFLDEDEYRIKQEKGLVALLDDMESKQRDLVRFIAPSRLV